jgi:hypothetical protein
MEVEKRYKSSPAKEAKSRNRESIQVSGKELELGN